MKKYTRLYQLGGILLFTFLLLFFPGNIRSVKAAETSLYAMDITTGSSGVEMEHIANILINYKDSRNQDRTYSVNPKYAVDYTWKYLKDSKNSTTAESVKNLQKWNNTLKANFEETCSNDVQNTEFVPYTEQTLFFSTYDEIESGKIESIQILTTGNTTWQIQRIAIARVDTSKAVKCYGYADISPIYQIDYSGTLLAEVNKKFSIGATEGKNIQIGGKRGLPGIEITQKKSEIKDKQGKEYYLKLDIADEAMAGMETNATKADGKSAGYSDIKLADMLFAKIYYQDVHGNNRIAMLPVLSNMYVSVDGKGEKIIGIGQQGDTIVTSCYLPDFKAILEGSGKNSGIDLEYGMENLQSYHLTLSSDENDAYTAAGRDKAAKESNEQLALTNVGIYSSNNVTLKAQIVNGDFEFSLNGKDKESNGAIPLYYYATTDRSGTNIQYGQTQKFKMKKNYTGTGVSGKNNVNDRYFVEITTSDAASAGTGDDLKISFNYKALDGSNKTTRVYSLKELSRDFYGYWPAIGNGSESIAYYRGAASRGTLKFLLNLTDVDSFLSADITLDGSDEWQMKSIEVSKVKSISPRLASFEDLSVNWSGGTVTSDRIFDREITKGATMALSTEEILLREKEQKQVSFTGSKSELENDKKSVWDPSVKELDYETACKGLGFNSTNVKYTVNVQVGGSAADGNDDSGSKNLFYFRLNFEDGSSSAYILANQQLSSDGFRSGQMETFTIGMNRDCGELISVDVIPDDIAKASDIYDKLNIESIRVIKEGSGALVPTWTISKAGWVGIDYTDDGEESAASDSSKDKGRSNAELAKNFKVTSSTYSVNLTFAITTGDYNGGSQFTGSLQGELIYTNGSGEKIPVTFDIVQAMYTYIDKNAKYSSDNKTVVADPTYMFRENTTDRFNLALSDVRSIDKLTIKATSSTATTWNIKSVGVTMVTEGGDLILNANDEYVYTGQSSKLTMQSSKSEPVAYSLAIKENGYVTQVIDFEENVIEGNGSYESNAAVITRTPESKKDQLNIFVYPKDTSNMGNYTVGATYRYTNTYGKFYQNGDTDLKAGPDCYYTLGISAEDMSVLRSLKLTATGKFESAKELIGDKVVIQRVREGVILETYEVDLGEKNLVGTWQGMGLQLTQMQSTETQTVYAYFGSGTTKKNLTDSDDVAVSIGFKSKNPFDPNVYHTPYVFLTDEGYKQIYEGMMAELHFNVPYMGEVTEIRVAKTGDVQAVLESSVVAGYTNDESGSLTLKDDATDSEKEEYKAAKEEALKNRICSSWSSIEVRSELQSEAIGYPITTNDVNSADTLMPGYVELTGGGESSDTENDLNINVRYKNRFDELSFVNLTNVKDKMTSDSSFESGKTVKVPMMLTNAQSINRLAFTMIEGGKNYTITSATVMINVCGKEQKQTVSKEVVVTQQGAEVNFISATMDVSAISYAADGSILASYNKSNPIALAVDKDGRIVVSVDYRSNSETDGFGYELYKVETSDSSGDTKPLARVSNESTVVSRNGDQITIVAEGLEAGSYQLQLKGSESKQSTTLEFTVSEPKG